ncbi:bacterioferritin [Segnochrobactrum spirostomi]|uniref:Bacterioferritin n=1 Tax=Segnochrobactrum spirostomi TaxID=2608987 RepID=A0A6A7XYZ7_9HYPH|nr:bacterioferritin [Segnochrobactrum spirostomi]MQT12000.1 bacterioferritin [Segnochrobactrum spirostomi]
MKGDKDVIDILNRALRHEHAAFNQFWLHSTWLSHWGHTRYAKKEYEEALEEMEHATKLMKRIIFLEGQPDLQVIPTLKVAANLEEVVKNDLEAEYEAVKLYREARALARDKGDYVSMELIEEILRDEEGHVDWLETQTSLIEAIGIANFAQLQSAPANEV